MRALNATFELFDTAVLQAAVWNGRMQQGLKFARTWETRRIARKYKNSGNEAKEYLKTKDIVFFDAAYFAPLVRGLAPS
jgi:hypothetical protein